MADEFELLNNDAFIQMQDVLVHQLDAEVAGTPPIDIARMISVKLAFIQKKIDDKLSTVKG